MNNNLSFFKKTKIEYTYIKRIEQEYSHERIYQWMVKLANHRGTGNLSVTKCRKVIERIVNFIFFSKLFLIKKVYFIAEVFQILSFIFNCGIK